MQWYLLDSDSRSKHNSGPPWIIAAGCEAPATISLDFSHGRLEHQEFRLFLFPRVSGQRIRAGGEPRKMPHLAQPQQPWQFTELLVYCCGLAGGNTQLATRILDPKHPKVLSQTGNFRKFQRSEKLVPFTVHLFPPRVSAFWRPDSQLLQPPAVA